MDPHNRAQNNKELSLKGMPIMFKQPKAHKSIVDRKSNNSTQLVLPFLEVMAEEETEVTDMEEENRRPSSCARGYPMNYSQLADLPQRNG